MGRLVLTTLGTFVEVDLTRVPGPVEGDPCPHCGRPLVFRSGLGTLCPSHPVLADEDVQLTTRVTVVGGRRWEVPVIEFEPEWVRRAREQRLPSRVEGGSARS